jgi:hypothetical protein
VRIPRTASLLAIALLLCALWATPAGAASATQTVKLHVAFDPDRAGASTTIIFGFTVSGTDGRPPPPVTGLDLRLPAHMGIATTMLGQADCQPQQLIEHGPQGCSANAQIGFGTALAVIPYSPRDIAEKAVISAFMGPPAGEQLTVLFYAEGVTPVFAQAIFTGIVLADTSPFGERLNTTVPLVSSWPEGPDAILESFQSTIGPLHLYYYEQLEGMTVAYQPRGITVPKHCPHGGFPFAAELTFENATSTTATTHVPCPR